ncbi:hypothetical protein [Nonomuraea sp. B19D2]|uniref:hypothetical protein n=1 Tax=Nonomuraea sp. B19D2 TaxID=3159561 RepID=UPI0032D9B8D0
MPDDDRLPKSLPRKWKAVACALEEGDSLPALSALVEKALAATIRDIGGVPLINEICDQVHRVARMRCHTLPLDGYRLELSPRHDRLPQTDVAWNRARVLLETRTEDLAANLKDTRHRVAVSVVRALAYHFGFSRILPALIDRAPWTADELRDRCAQVLSQPGIDKLADGLLRRPDGHGVRAPRHKRPSVEAVLSMSLEDLR